jgi:hypothetical protein
MVTWGAKARRRGRYARGIGGFGVLSAAYSQNEREIATRRARLLPEPCASAPRDSLLISAISVRPLLE